MLGGWVKHIKSDLCMCVHVHVLGHVCTHVHACMHVCSRMHMCVHMCMHVCVCAAQMSWRVLAKCSFPPAELQVNR